MPHRKKTTLKTLPLIKLGVLLAGVYLICTAAYYVSHSRVQLPSPPRNALYKLKNAPIDARVKDLVSRMTLTEKIGQMALVDKDSLIKPVDIVRYNIGGLLSGASTKPPTNTAQGWKDMVEGYKEQAAKTRLQIPLLYGVDANHGNSNVPGATVFPHSIGLGASGNAELVQQVADATTQEVAAVGVNWIYSPSLDEPTDIRWGRVYEAFSDSSTLNAVLGAAYIRGAKVTTGDTQMVVTAKHYIGAGAMQWNTSMNKKYKIDQGITPVDESRLDQDYLPPYLAVIQAGVDSVMVGLNRYGNDRVIDSHYLLTDKLKTELGFKGFVVSDWYGMYEGSKTSIYQSNINAINAGVDMAMLPYNYKGFVRDVTEAVQDNQISQSRIDDAVSRILYEKFKAGLFDSTVAPPPISDVGSTAHRALARKAASASAVLLKNNGQVLPLKAGQHILVAGSGADNFGRQAGGWTLEWQGVDGNWPIGTTSILAGLKQVAPVGTKIEYSQNASFATSQKADVGLAIVSEKPAAEGWGDNPNPTLSASDLQVIAQLKKHANNVVVVIVAGRPLLLNNQFSSWDGLVMAWLPGSEGEGIADVLFGKTRFTAHLPLPWPANIAQLPIASNGKTKDGTSVLFTRGFGL